VAAWELEEAEPAAGQEVPAVVLAASDRIVAAAAEVPRQTPSEAEAAVPFQVRAAARRVLAAHRGLAAQAAA